MQPSPQKKSKAEQSRINGAKSRGPKTPQGQSRARTASLQHGAFAAEPNLRPTVDEPLFEALTHTYQANWRPANQYLADKVEDLAAYRWEINRLRAVRRQFLARVYNNLSDTFNEQQEGISLVCATEILATTDSETLARFDLRIRRCNLEISRIERDVIRVHRHHLFPGPSHNLLQTNEPEPEITHGSAGGPIAWAEENLEIALDVHQAELLSATGQTVVLNAARYSGKTTALALRAIHSSLAHPDLEIACISPNGDLKRKVAETAAILGLKPANIAYSPSATAAIVILDDAATLPPDTLASLNPAAQIVMASTPQGALGFFFEAFHESNAVTIAARAQHCDLLDAAFLRHASAKLSQPAYRQEFQCEFLTPPEPRCRLLPLTQ